MSSDRKQAYIAALRERSIKTADRATLFAAILLLLHVADFDPAALSVSWLKFSIGDREFVLGIFALVYLHTFYESAFPIIAWIQLEDAPYGIWQGRRAIKRYSKPGRRPKIVKMGARWERRVFFAFSAPYVVAMIALCWGAFGVALLDIGRMIATWMERGF